MDEAKLNDDPRQEHATKPEGPVMNPDDTADPVSTESGTDSVSPAAGNEELTAVIAEDHADGMEEIITDEVLLTEQEGILPEHADEFEGVHEDLAKAAEAADYSRLDRAELLQALKNLIANTPIHQIGDEADLIKINFYKKYKIENERRRKKFIEEGGKMEDFHPEEDPLETEFKEVFHQYRELRADYNRKQEEEKQENLKAKYQIIEEIKELVNRSESINATFQEFRELQKRWRSIGPVPQQNVKDLWETYNHHVEVFYDYIKLNKELRDLDFKKNLETKISLCERAEELLLEPDVPKAFRILQELHEEWRDTGPVPHEMREEIWNRFKEITSKINKRHHEYYESLKSQQVKNLEQKTALCEKAEEIAASGISTMKEWEKRYREILELQQVWKTIGFAPRKENQKIYQRFRAACDDFFRRRREFFQKMKEEQHNNLQLKTELCLQAEALKDSTEWKKTTEDLINIQKRWKEIGPVPRRYSDAIWKRFRAACDEFFNRKAAYYAGIDSQYEENLKKKLELIEEIEKYQPVESVEENFRNLKEFQRRWTEIGFVPLKDKEQVQQRYKEAITRHFEGLKMDDERKNLLRFRNRLDALQQKPRGNQKIKAERERLIGKLKQLENEISLWENNIGFFIKSKNAESMISEVQKKIDDAKARITELEEKIRIIDMHISES